MNLLSFLEATHGSSVAVAVFPAGEVLISARQLGFFAGIFWTAFALAVSGRVPGHPRRGYGVLVGYVLAATMVNAVYARFRDWEVSAAVSYLLALFAGASITVLMASPVVAALARRHAIPEPSGARALVLAPLALTPLIWIANHSLAGSALLGSAILGLWTALFLANLGAWAIPLLPGRAAVVAAALFVIPQHILLGVAPEIVKRLLALSMSSTAVLS